MGSERLEISRMLVNIIKYNTDVVFSSVVDLPEAEEKEMHHLLQLNKPPHWKLELPTDALTVTEYLDSLKTGSCLPSRRSTLGLDRESR
eukprot:NODE_8334_length_362_cov_89.603834_g6590_i0.p2 GENE.NODE_8334_length_362_cov_89.603834_g6590_i0~~NODE_8334_length_362_cov_89.603834_g6590_i0.p2  ORF type:complete len:97 (-),score=28.75 NODE_8334_length_362_cov_89.603834_g6590_i0:72-338(-)